ncbi:MAG: CHAT domain-containing protein [Bacteroidales bacterium]|nr:CHAT domain-containing protein [Bacteroidales bacterium]
MKIVSIFLSFFLIHYFFSAHGQIEKSTPEQKINSLSQKAWDYFYQGKYDSAEYFYQNTINLQEAYFGHYDNHTAGTYLNLGAVYRRLYHLKDALKYLNIAEAIFKQTSPDTYLLGYIYNNKGNIYYTYSDYGESERYYKQSLNQLIRTQQYNNDIFEIVYLNLFNLLITQNRLEEAETLIEEIKEIEVIGKNSYSKNKYLAQAYDILGHNELALIEISKGKAKLASDKNSSPHDLIEFNFREASVHLKLNNLSKALELSLDNIGLFQNIKTIDYQKLADTYWLVGNIYFIKEEYRNCYDWLSNVINELNEALKNSDITQIDPTSRILKSFFVDLNHLQAQTCVALHEETGNNKYLEQSLKLYTEIIEVLKIFKIHMRNDKSKFSNTENRLSLIHEATNVALQLYETSKQEKYFNKAFNYAENSKSFILLSQIKEVEAIQFAELPKKILDRETNLSGEISGYEELIFEENISLEPDSLKLATLTNKLFELKDDYNALLDSIELLYPNYFELKYNPHFITPSEAQFRLHRHEALVEYLLSDSILTTFVIDKEQIEAFQQRLPEGFSKKCIDYFTLIRDQNFSQDVHQTYRDFVRLSRMFHEILVAPVLELTESREITFVPDGAIMYLPFEAFLTADVDEEYIDYHSLPYLIHDVSVGYSYSSTLLFNKRFKTGSPERKVLAFAPSYNNLLGEDPLEWDRQSNPDFLVPLQGAVEEVEYISKRVPSVAFMDSMASEANFKKHASDYYVLHLAMHTILNDQEPMYSRLAFTRNFNDTTEDHDLFTYEIYNMQLNADMVVLSSCNSGYGKMQKGEGMMSMARGFIYAGCPSIIMTLWQVSDRSSSELMSNFYKHLKKGKSKKSALRQAKIDYIRASDNLKSNPYFWSSFLVVGDNSPLYMTSAGWYLAMIILAFLIVVLLATYKKQIRKKLKKFR